MSLLLTGGGKHGSPALVDLFFTAGITDSVATTPTYTFTKAIGTHTTEADRKLLVALFLRYPAGTNPTFISMTVDPAGAAVAGSLIQDQGQVLLDASTNRGKVLLCLADISGEGLGTSADIEIVFDENGTECSMAVFEAVGLSVLDNDGAADSSTTDPDAVTTPSINTSAAGKVVVAACALSGTAIVPTNWAVDSAAEITTNTSGTQDWRGSVGRNEAPTGSPMTFVATYQDLGRGAIAVASLGPS